MGFEVYGTKFGIDERYSFVKALGKGAYGVVCSVRDAKSGRKLAIKKICPMAKSVYDAKHTLREIRLLRHCGQHPNVITLMDLMVNEELDELYIGMECMDTDLHRIIQSSQKLSISHHKHFMYQLILGIEFLHSNGILHRDLKPANLLVSKNCDLRISDFGLARRAPNATDGKPLMTEHVVTRWYRPPELMLSPDGKYTAAVDVWSIGCIFAELLGRTPLFPGKNFVHQLQLIFDVIGTPRSSETSYIKNSQAIQFLRSLPKKGPVDLASIYPHACSDAIHFMNECIHFSAKDRIKVRDALNHPFFDNAPLKGKKIQVPSIDERRFCFDFEQQDLDEKQLRRIIIQEVEDFNLETKNRAPRQLSAAKPIARPMPKASNGPAEGEAKPRDDLSSRSSSRPSHAAAVPETHRQHRSTQQMDVDGEHPLTSSSARKASRTSRRLARSTGARHDPCDDEDEEDCIERENEQTGNNDLHQGRRLKKKSRSFTSRILSTSSKLTKSSSSSSTARSGGDAPGGGGSSTRLPSVHRTTSMRNMSSNQRDEARSPMSCSSADSFHEEQKHEPQSSMLPIRNILRKSRQISQPDHSTDHMMQAHSSSTGRASSARVTRSTSSSSSVKGVTVPQPFQFSHPRNKESISSSATVHSARYRTQRYQ